MRPALLLALLVWTSTAGAVEDIAIEEGVAELLVTTAHPEEVGKPEGRRWAVLPQIGFGPETGPVAGVKFEHRNLADSGFTLDLDATLALNKQQALHLGLGSPHLFGDRLLVQLRGRYDTDPQFDFFGLGNNDVGPDPASTHRQQRADGDLEVGWRPTSRLALNAGVELRDVHISRGERDDHRPFTVDAFPRLVGVRGGHVNPFSLSLVWSTRDSVVRPLHGGRVILKVAHTNRSLLSDFEYTRYVGDLSWMTSTPGGRHVLGVRIDGGYVAGPSHSVPFWELEELGGDDTLRGFFPHRFRGRGRALLGGEYRVLLTRFDFYRLWRVQLDGVLFGEGGRVFLNRQAVERQFRLTGNLARRLVQDLRYSYGGGVRIALSEALVARVDIGFSDEEKGLVYLAFGHTF